MNPDPIAELAAELRKLAEAQGGDEALRRAAQLVEDSAEAMRQWAEMWQELHRTIRELNKNADEIKNEEDP